MSTATQQQIIANYKKFISQASTHYLNLQQAFYIDDTNKTVYYSENPNIKISEAEKTQYSIDINSTKRFFGYPISIVDINGLFLYKIAHTVRDTDNFAPFNGNIQLTRMFLYYFFNKDTNAQSDGTKNLKEIWHMHYCFEIALKNSVNVDEKNTYKYTNGTTQLYGTIENIAYKLYNENLIDGAIYQNFENDVIDFNTQLNTTIYKDQTASQYITPTTYEYGRYTTSQHGLLGVAASLNALLQNTNIAQIIIQDVNLSINNSDIKDLTINQNATQLISNYSSTTNNEKLTNSTTPKYSDNFTTDYNTSFVDARAKYILAYSQIETKENRWYNLYNTHPELHYQDIGRYLGYQWLSNDKPTNYVFSGKFYNASTNRVWGSGTANPYKSGEKLQVENLSPYYMAFQNDGNLCWGKISYNTSSMQATLTNKLCINSLLKNSQEYCIAEDKIRRCWKAFLWTDCDSCTATSTITNDRYSVNNAGQTSLPPINTAKMILNPYGYFILFDGAANPNLTAAELSKPNTFKDYRHSNKLYYLSPPTFKTELITQPQATRAIMQSDGNFVVDIEGLTHLNENRDRTFALNRSWLFGTYLLYV